MKNSFVFVQILQIGYIVCFTCNWSSWSSVPQCHRYFNRCSKAYSRNCICDKTNYTPLLCDGKHLKLSSRMFIFSNSCKKSCQITMNWCPWKKWSPWSAECSASTRSRFRECCNVPGRGRYDFGCLPEQNNVSNVQTEQRNVKCSNSFWRITVPIIGITLVIILGIFVLMIRWDRRRYFGTPNASFHSQRREPLHRDNLTHPVEPSAPLYDFNCNNIVASHVVCPATDLPPSYESLYPAKP